MKRYTVAEYSKLKDTSVQNIYAKIKRNTIKHTTVDNTVYVLIEDNDNTIDNVKNIDTTNLDNEIKEKLNDSIKELKKTKRLLKKALKQNTTLQLKIDDRDKNIKQLNKQLNNEKDQSITVLKQFITEQRALSHQPIVNDDEIVVNDVKSKRKKKSKKDKR